MPSFTLTNMAKADLKEIGRYTLKNWGREQRNHYLSILDVSFHQLASNPLKGKDCNEIRSDYRKLNVGSHVIFYRQTIADTIEIVRVMASKNPLAIFSITNYEETFPLPPG